MTALGSRNTFTWRDYEHGRNSPRQGSTGSFSSRVHFDESSPAPDSRRADVPEGNEEDSNESDGLRRRRSSVSMRISSLAQVGGVNSLGNFARSWQRAAGFNELPPRRPTILVSGEDDEEAIGTRRSEPSPTEPRSLLRQQLEGQGSASQPIITDTPTTTSSTPRGTAGRSSDARGSDVVDRAPYLASPYASNYGGIYGSLSSRVNESSLQHAGRLFEEQQLSGAGDPDKEDEPLLVQRIEGEDGKIVEQVVGRSTLPQTVLNSVNVLVGIGILSLPLALRYAGWVIGIPSLLLAAVATRYTAGLLAKCLHQYPKMTHFSELASVAFGLKTRIMMEMLITLELAAAAVALVVLFADSLNALLPGWGLVEWKIVCGVIILPLNFVPLRYLSITSVFGVLCSLGIVTDGLKKAHYPGSLLEPAPTHPFPVRWSNLPLSFGLFMAPWGGHTVFPSIYRDMRHPRKFGKALNITFTFTYLIDCTMTVVGHLMFGISVMDEVTSNILLTQGFPHAISIAMVIFIAIIPITKIPLNTRPIISSADKSLGLDARSIPSSPSLDGLSGYSRGMLRCLVRLVVTVVILIVAVFVPSFDIVMSLMGSVLCFSICIILPLAFYLKIFGNEISWKEKAALLCFNKHEYMLEAQASIKDVFESTQSLDSDFAVVPFENSTYGTVVFTLDLLVDRDARYSDLLVCGELYLPVRHSLVGHSSKRQSGSLSHDHAWDEVDQMQVNCNPKRSSQMMKDLQHISTIYSHPAAFGQCEQFLSLYLKGVEKQDVSSTSRAAELVAEEGANSRAAAISSSLAAEVHGLKLLAESIQDQDNNSTRFFVLRNRKTDAERHALPSILLPHGNNDKWKTLVSFTLPQSPSGTLADALQVFKNHGLNLTSINSRPSLEHIWHYVFLIEVQGKREVDGRGIMNQAFGELETKTKGWKWLGSWINQAK
ncbi:MAG: hypothetical protein Q9220_004976 [cf. Caloplaca sp. 1 TL-2023]